jgi:hypothetical protein
MNAKAREELRRREYERPSERIRRVKNLLPIDNSEPGQHKKALGLLRRLRAAPAMQKQYPGLYDGATTCTYTLRHPQSHQDTSFLRVFQEMSESSAAIEAGQPLSLDRVALYSKWCKKNRKCFLLLEERFSDGSDPLSIGCSIVLPITDIGSDVLRLARRSAVDLVENEIVGSNAAEKDIKHLLLDTWVAWPYCLGKLAPHMATLLLRHIRAFWDPVTHTQLDIWVEVDTPQLDCAVSGMRFHPLSLGGNAFDHNATHKTVTRRLDWPAVFAEGTRVAHQEVRTTAEKVILEIMRVARRIHDMEGFAVMNS